MAEPVTFQETNEGSTSTVTVVETDEHDAQVSVHRFAFSVKMYRGSRGVFQWMRKSCTFKWIKQMHTNDNSPLKGIRVLDLTRIVAGPYCTMILSDLGAEVIKIEKPGTGDESRKWGPPFIANTEESCYFVSLNRNKKSICIDLKLNEGRNILYNLAKESDVLVENFVPGKLADLKLGYDDFQKIAPHLIYCSITGYGSVGPYKNRPGYDVIAASMGGLLHITGSKDGEPVKVGVAVTDLATGLYAHGAIIAAIWKRSKTGRGQKIDCNLLSTQVANLINVGSNYLNAGIEPTKWGTAHESIVPYQAFATKDGYFTIGTGSDKQFQDLCKKIGHPELGHDEKYLTNRLRVKHRKELILFLNDVMKSKTNEEWKNILKNSSFPCGPVNSIKQTFEDVHLKEIGIVKTIAHPTAGEVKVVGPAVSFSEGGNFVRDPPPVLGQHTTDVLKNVLGYSDEQIYVLKKNNVVQ